MVDAEYLQAVRNIEGFSSSVCLQTLVKEIEELNGYVDLGAKKLTDFMGRCIAAEYALRDYDQALEALSVTETSRDLAKQDLQIIRERHAETLRLAGL